jgi:hypothetical protein
MSEIQDFMPVGGGPQRLVRRLVGVHGCLQFQLELQPRFDYGLVEPTVTIAPGRAVVGAPGRSRVAGMRRR